MLPMNIFQQLKGDFTLITFPITCQNVTSNHFQSLTSYIGITYQTKKDFIITKRFGAYKSPEISFNKFYA